MLQIPRTSIYRLICDEFNLTNIDKTTFNNEITKCRREIGIDQQFDIQHVQ
jgi:hypothetical protein